MDYSLGPSISSFETITSSSSSSLRPRHFQYDVLSNKQTRLFKLDLNGEDEPLSGALLTTYHIWNVMDQSHAQWGYRIKHDVDKICEIYGRGYDTVSYAWGDQSETFPLYLSVISSKLGPDKQVRTNFEPYRNGPIQIGSNLKAMLEELRRRKHSPLLWIDAICVNQANDAEKKMQISMMCDIFQWAESGHIWLGQGTAEERQMMQYFPALTEQMEEVSRNGMVLDPVRGETFEVANLPEPYEEVWQHVGSIMRNPYWSRLWALQEAVVPFSTGDSGKLMDLPPNNVLYGDTTTQLEVFNRFCIAATSLGLRSWIITGRTDLQPNSLYAFDGIDEIRTCRQSWGADFWGVALSALLMGTRRRKATMDADNVYGMMAMMDHHTSRSLMAESGNSIQDLFVNFGKHYLRNEVKENLLNHTATRTRMEGLPSWCPNFASSPATLSLGSRWIGRLEASDEQKAQMYTAGFKREGKWKLPKSKLKVLKNITNVIKGRNQSIGVYDTSNPRQLTLLPGTNTIRVSGAHLDVVVAVAECNPAADSSHFFHIDNMVITEHWDMHCLSLAMQYLSRDVDCFDVYARTITANRVTVDSGHDAAMLIDHEHKLDFVESYRQFRAYIQATKALGGDLAVEEYLSPEHRQFIDVLSRVTCRRRFFATERGRIGLGPADTEIGDTVCMFFYCPTPYIVRPHPSALNQFIGETYVHGLMYGEALDMIDRGELCETQWWLA